MPGSTHLSISLSLCPAEQKETYKLLKLLFVLLGDYYKRSWEKINPMDIREKTSHGFLNFHHLSSCWVAMKSHAVEVGADGIL